MGETYLFGGRFRNFYLRLA